MVNINISEDNKVVRIYVMGTHVLDLTLDDEGECSGVVMHKNVPVSEDESVVLGRDPVIKFLRERKKELEAELQQSDMHPDYPTIKLSEIEILEERWTSMKQEGNA